MTSLTPQQLIVVGKLQLLTEQLERAPKLRECAFRHQAINAFGTFSKAVETAISLMPRRYRQAS